MCYGTAFISCECVCWEQIDVKKYTGPRRRKVFRTVVPYVMYDTIARSE